MDLSTRKLLFQAADDRRGQNDITDRTEPDNKDLQVFGFQDILTGFLFKKYLVISSKLIAFKQLVAETPPFRATNIP
jgi:hypothetical protein